jgi:hypothetical protein
VVLILAMFLYLEAYAVILTDTGKHRYNVNKAQNKGLVREVIALMGRWLTCVYIVCVLVLDRQNITEFV